MLVNEAIRLHVIADASVAALIGARLYNTHLSQTVTLPATAYLDITGTSERAAGIALFRYRFFSTCDLAHGGADMAEAVADAIRVSLEGFVGTITDATVSPIETLEILGVRYDGSFSGYDDKSQTHQRIGDFLIWAEQTGARNRLDV